MKTLYRNKTKVLFHAAVGFAAVSAIVCPLSAQTVITGYEGVGGAAISSRALTTYAPSSLNLAAEFTENAGVHAIQVRPDAGGYNQITSDYWSGSTYLPLTLSGRGQVSDFVLQTNGRVGIGTTSPGTATAVVGEKLDVEDSYIRIGHTAGPFLNFYQSTAGTDLKFTRIGSVGGNVSIDSVNDAYSSAVSRLYIQAATGNIGIGTVSPSAKLTVQGTFSRFLETAGVNGLTVLPNNSGYNAIYSDYTSGSTALPLALGTFPVTNAIVVLNTGSVGIGTTSPGSYKLAVNGSVRAKEVVVDTGWSDYVFASNYSLMPLSEVEQHIKEEKHLPGIPSAKEVADHGITLGAMESKLLAKIEELTLHQIEQEKEIARLKAKVGELEHAR